MKNQVVVVSYPNNCVSFAAITVHYDCHAPITLKGNVVLT